MSLLHVRGLTIGLQAGGDRENAVTDVSFDVAAGEVLCIVGESGSGKSVSAGAIMGLLPAALIRRSGEVRLDGQSLLGLSNATMRDQQFSMRLSRAL
jgi:peptide/nickel transport system ATP-binding protein